MTPQENWTRCRPWIEAALITSPGFETIEDVEALAAVGRYQIWFGENSVAVTEIAEFARRKILIVAHGGGDLTELLDVLEPRMCVFAVQNGCDGIMGMGRKGWERVTEKRGYRFAYLNMIKDLVQ